MNKQRLVVLGAVVGLCIAFCIGASYDGRSINPGAYPVARLEFAQQTFPMTATAALAPTLSNVNGTIYAIEVITTDTEDGITYTVALTNSSSTSLFSEAAMTDNTKHWRDAVSHKAVLDADFNPIPVNTTTLTCTITPSAAPDAGEVGAKTANVDVYLYVR
jgi:hypothetical protein